MDDCHHQDQGAKTLEPILPGIDGKDYYKDVQG
jgi:hypothetical protein